MTYNLTGISENVTGVLSLTQQVNNSLMFGWLGVMFLIAVAFVLVTSFLFTTGDTKRSIASTAFITFGLSIFLRMLSLVPDLAVWVSLIIGSIAIAMTWRR